MAWCYTCRKNIVFGGIRDQDLRFCSKRCHQQQACFLESLELVTHLQASDERARMLASPCPLCHQARPVNTHQRAFTWSLLLWGQIDTETFVSCRVCALRLQSTWTLGSLLLGWWSLPFGPVLTIVAVSYNGLHALRSLLPSPPRPDLLVHARRSLARRWSDAQHPKHAPVPILARAPRPAKAPPAPLGLDVTGRPRMRPGEGRIPTITR